MKVNRKQIEEIVDRALAGCEVTDYPSVCISNTQFGTSIYIQNQRKKMRFSDHSVTNFDRVTNEEHYYISDVDKVDEDIRRLFSDEYVTLILKNGDQSINFHRQVLKSEIQNWKSAKVWYKEEQELPILLDQIGNYEVVKQVGLTKKGNKMICKILKSKFSFGAYNVITRQIDRTRFCLAGDYEVEVWEK